MKTKPNPIPWTAYAGQIRDADGNVLASYPSTTGDTQDEKNARKMAAAPQMLEALRIAERYLDQHRPKGKIQDIFTALNIHENQVMKPIRAAIAAASKP